MTLAAVPAIWTPLEPDPDVSTSAGRSRSRRVAVAGPLALVAAAGALRLEGIGFGPRRRCDRSRAWRATCGGDRRVVTGPDAAAGEGAHAARLRQPLLGPVEFVEEPLVEYRFHDGQMHPNVAAMEHDFLRILARTFGELGMPRSLRHPAYAQAHRVLAGSYLEAGERVRGLRHVLAALRHRPALVRDLTRPRNV